MERVDNEWVSPADIEIYNDDDQLVATLDASDAEIYPRNQTIKANNIPIQYDQTENVYYAETTYSYPVTKAKFTIDIQNSVLPVNKFSVYKILLGDNVIADNNTNTDWTFYPRGISGLSYISIVQYDTFVVIIKNDDNYEIRYRNNNSRTNDRIEGITKPCWVYLIHSSSSSLQGVCGLYSQNNTFLWSFTDTPLGGLDYDTQIFRVNINYCDFSGISWMTFN